MASVRPRSTHFHNSCCQVSMTIAFSTTLAQQARRSVVFHDDNTVDQKCCCIWALQLLRSSCGGSGGQQEATLVFGPPQDVQPGRVCRPRKVHQHIRCPNPSTDGSLLSSATWVWLQALGSYCWVSPQNGSLPPAFDLGHHSGFACNGRLLLHHLQFDWAGEVTKMGLTTRWNFCQYMVSLETTTA